MQPNVFFVKKSEILGRIDPLQFHQERRETLAKLKAARQTVYLISVTHARKQVVSESEKPYIGLENIQSNTGEYIETNEKSTFSSANVFMKGDILFPKLRPYLNKVHLAEFDGICSTEFHVFNSNGQYLNEFLTIYLRSNLIVNQTKYLMTGNTLPRLQTADIHQLPIPVVDLDFQAALVAKYQQAEQARQAKLAQADTLSGSIQDYLLRELGITVPQADNALNKRIFTVKASEILGQRFDCFPRQTWFHDFFEKLNQAKYPFTSLGRLALDIKNGVEIREYAEIGKRYLRVSDLSENGIVDNNIRFVIADIPKRIKLNRNCILVSRSGSLGLANAVTPELEDVILSSHIFRVELDTNKIIPDFLECYIRSQAGQHQFKMLNNGGVIPEISQTALRQFQISLPPLDTQRAIVAHIAQIRAQIAALQQEAADLLADTQREMERLILG